MKAELKAKFVQHFNQKKQDEGFTLIELLVAIIIIGILSAIAVPSFLNQAKKGKQAEAKQYTSAMNRGQQAYFLEKGTFTDTIADLGIGSTTQTENYKYNTVATFSGNAVATSKGASRHDTLRSYAGVVAVSTTGNTSEATTLAILCEANNVGGGTVLNGTSSGNPLKPSCPNNFSELKLD